MGGLRKFVDKIKPTFSEGGKLSFLASTFDASKRSFSCRIRPRAEEPISVIATI